MKVFTKSLSSLALITTFAAAPASADDFVIGLSNSYYGNTWRHIMVDAYEAAAEEAKTSGRIADFVTLNGDGSVEAQVAHINDLILRGVDAILVVAASETALNGVVERACAAGILVVGFDNVPTAECAYKLTVDFQDYGTTTARGVADVMGGEGNLLVVRGMRGNGAENAIYSGQQNVLNDNPGLNVVAELFGEWSGPVAQAEVANALPNLPHIDGVFAQGGGDAYGVLQAFLQSSDYAGDIPPISGGNSTDFVNWWRQANADSGYSTVSAAPDPSIGASALWFALNILEGATPEKVTPYPVTLLTDDDLASLGDLPDNSVVSVERPESWVLENLLN
ncbi:substrate-binding domain-containing protein [Roseobacter sp. HKCCD7870]|uniref:substrate-binding domain-containing protein n=1 Tax=Roseobacter sp. HKCCD7870 TaxID=3120343 RepID=UPI0030ED568D